MIEGPSIADAVFARNPLSANLDGTTAPAAARTDARICDAAMEFEAVFLSQMLGHMFAELETNGPFGGGQSEEMFRSLMINEYGRLISQSGGIGIADTVMAEMLEIQERSSS